MPINPPKELRSKNGLFNPKAFINNVERYWIEFNSSKITARIQPNNISIPMFANIFPKPRLTILIDSDIEFPKPNAVIIATIKSTKAG